MEINIDRGISLFLTRRPKIFNENLIFLFLSGVHKGERRKKGDGGVVLIEKCRSFLRTSLKTSITVTNLCESGPNSLWNLGVLVTRRLVVGD